MLVKYQQNRMVQTTRNFEFFFLKFFYNHFLQRVDAILEDFSAAEIIFQCQAINLKTFILQCSKNYGTPTLL